MKVSRRLFQVLFVALMLVFADSAARGDQIYTVTLDTSQLATNYTGPFGIDFELVGSNGTTVTISDISFGAGGNVVPGAFLTGGVSGDLGSSVVLNDSSNFFNDFNQGFAPGTTLTFTVDSTDVPPLPGSNTAPDNFSIVIFSGYSGAVYTDVSGPGGMTIPTIDPSGADTFVNINANGSPGSNSYAGYSSLGGDIPVTVTPGSAVPEPSSGVAMLLGVAGLLGFCWQHNRDAPVGRETR
jgi:hypothetical protein